MKSRLLFPTYSKIIGWLLAVPGFVLGYTFVYNNRNFVSLSFGSPINFEGIVLPSYTDELALSLVIIGFLLIAFSRKKVEDELIARPRLDALYWSIAINYMLFFLLVWFIDPVQIQIYNFFTPLLIFIARFNYLIHFKKETFIVKTLYFLPHKPFRMLNLSGARYLKTNS